MKYRTIVADPPWHYDSWPSPMSALLHGMKPGTLHHTPPYVELFSRRHRLGWDVWGNESANTAQLGEPA